MSAGQPMAGQQLVERHATQRSAHLAWLTISILLAVLIAVIRSLLKYLVVARLDFGDRLYLVVLTLLYLFCCALPRS
eukprot:6473960-Amphidinium_carterae.2